MSAYDPTANLLERGEDEGQPVAEAAPPREAASLTMPEGPTGGPVIIAERAPAAPEVAPGPAVPIPLPLRNVSGTYVGVSGAFELDLRVDVDGSRPMHRVSGDFVQIVGATRTYFGSFVVDHPTISATPAGEVIRGLGRFTFTAGAPVVQVTIPRRRILQPAAPATVQFFTVTNHPGATYVCNFSSAAFRTVTLQTESVSNIVDPVFTTYNTGSLPSGGSARTLSVVAAYAEAGIRMVPVAPGPIILPIEAQQNADPRWSDAELMASMKKHFARYAVAPHWDMWQVVCWEHELGPGLLGIMFDSQRRQGCAVFYRGMSGVTAPQLREKLYTHVHELGHCFNLMHSWQKSLANPPGVDNPSALSWMNYPWRYPGGDAAFWTAFPFQFVDEELIHLRHAFRNNIIPSGNPFTVGAAEIDPQLMADPVEDISGLEFVISAAQTGPYLFGEPVALNFCLSSFDRRGRLVHPNLHPSTSGVSIAIARPDGRAVAFEPLVEHLMQAETELLEQGADLIDSAYIGYGRGGAYFDQPGRYRVRAIYHAPDGSRILSNVLDIRVRHPTSAEDNEVAELMMGDQQGELFALSGSDDDSLADGNRELDIVIEKHARHPLAAYARYVKGINQARTFKTIDNKAPGRLLVRKADLAAAQQMLSAAVAATTRLDNISKAQGLERLAAAQHAVGDTAGATQAQRSAQELRAAVRVARRS